MTKRIIFVAAVAMAGVVAYRKRDQIKQWAEPHVDRLLAAVEAAAEEHEIARHSTA